MQTSNAARTPYRATHSGSKKVAAAAPKRLTATAMPSPEPRIDVGKSSGKYT
jgi:hypothetical protein